MQKCRIGSYRYHNTEIGLAELLQALVLLEPDSEARSIIAAALGFEWKEMKERVRDDSESQMEPPTDLLQSDDEEVISDMETPEQASEHEVTVDSHKTMLPLIGQGDQNLEVLLDSSIPASTEELEPTSVELHMKSPRYQPLLRDEWLRGLMSAMLATPTASQEIDWRMLERHVVNGRPLDRLPWRQRPTLKRGVQLFLDHSESMQPFWRDEKELFERLQRLLGPHNVKVWWLEVDKWFSTKSQLRWHSKPPDYLSEGTPLLVVSDFGIGADQYGYGILDFVPWLPLLDLAQNHCCPVMALIPAPESFWTKKLKQLIPYAFVWDIDTSIQSVSRSRSMIH